MSALKPGSLAVIIAGCPENIGLVVEIIEHIGPYDDKEDAYSIRTVTGRPFHQIWNGGDLLRNHSNECITDRHKLRPLVGGTDESDLKDVVVGRDEVVS